MVRKELLSAGLEVSLGLGLYCAYRRDNLCNVSSFCTCELGILIYLINGIGKLNFIQPCSDLLILVPKFGDWSHSTNHCLGFIWAWTWSWRQGAKEGSEQVSTKSAGCKQAVSLKLFGYLLWFSSAKITNTGEQNCSLKRCRLWHYRRVILVCLFP